MSRASPPAPSAASGTTPKGWSPSSSTTTAQELARLVAAKGPDAVSERQARLDDLKITLKENIELGEVVRLEAGDSETIDSYLHVQGGRGVNGVLVVLAGGDKQLAHDVAVHVAFARPHAA